MCAAAAACARALCCTVAFQRATPCMINLRAALELVYKLSQNRKHSSVASSLLLANMANFDNVSLQTPLNESLTANNDPPPLILAAFSASDCDSGAM